MTQYKFIQFLTVYHIHLPNADTDEEQIEHLFIRFMKKGFFESRLLHSETSLLPKTVLND